jgi:peroxiredoxin
VLELWQHIRLQLERIISDSKGVPFFGTPFLFRLSPYERRHSQRWCYDVPLYGVVRAALLRTRQLIPPLTIHTPDGRTVRGWDYKQKKNLVIAFLDTDCGPCEDFLRQLASQAAALREKEAIALVVFLEQPARRLTDSLPAEIIVGADTPGRAARAFLGDDAFASRGYVRGGVFVTDRYGELSAQWPIERHKFPSLAEILSALDYVQMACDGCGTPLWTAE